MLRERPLILPRRCYVYPREAEEVERGALEVLVHPSGEGARGAAIEPFLATCALGFADPIAPSGVWACPNPSLLCAVAGGYAYLIDTGEPALFEQVGYRPVLGVLNACAEKLLLFIGNRAILAYDAGGQAWESPLLSSEGIEVTTLENGLLHGVGWSMQTDQEMPFVLNLADGSTRDEH